MADPFRHKRVAPLLATARRGRTVAVARRSWLTVLSGLLLAATASNSLPPLVTAATVEPTQFASLTSISTDLDISVPSWVATADCTTFERVVCDDSGNVVELALDKIRNADGDYITEVVPAITGLTSLSKLNLNDNNIMDFAPEIADMTSLKVLSLQYNRLTTFPFSGFPSLEQLDLYVGRLTSIPASVSELSNLLRLGLSYNYIVDIATEFTSLTRLGQLKMHNNFMKTFPFSGLYSLTYLDLFNDLLTSIPPSITQLSSLTFIDMGSNLIIDIATELTALTKLAELGLYNNNDLATFPFSGLDALSALEISYSIFARIPPSISQLSNLVYLNFRKNQISSIATEFTSLKKLSYLNLRHNSLPTFPFSGLNSLESLYLQFNRLKSISPSIVQLASLKELDVRGNEGLNVPGALGYLPALRILSVASSRKCTSPCRPRGSPEMYSNVFCSTVCPQSCKVCGKPPPGCATARANANQVLCKVPWSRSRYLRTCKGFLCLCVFHQYGHPVRDSRTGKLLKCVDYVTGTRF